jgi:iron complex outermembrane receptor protein
MLQIRNPLPRKRWRACIQVTIPAVLLTAFLTLSARAAKPLADHAVEQFSDSELIQLKKLSIEELMQVRVTSVSRKPQPLNEAPAAVFVISSDDLRRSGATSIAEALRLAPGVQVARIDRNKWAISARGLNGRFANKLLVLQDGRRLYNSAYSGVFWNLQDTVLDNIDRIEVIRGPGAAMWGTNAVNGVVNIITKPAKTTRGGLVTFLSGTGTPGIAEFRYGSDFYDVGAWRISAKGLSRGAGNTMDNGDGHDGWDMGRAGWRMDLEPTGSTTITVQGDIYAGSAGQSVILPDNAVPALTRRVDEDVDKRGGNALVRVEQTLDEGTGWSIQGYYDRIEHKETVSRFTQDTFDLDLQYELSPGTRHDMICGVETRLTKTGFNDTEYVTWQDNHAEEIMVSAFVQDRIELIRDRLSLTLGARAEFNEISGCELQPNARLLWNLTPCSSIWLAVSRASRMPSVGERKAVYLNRYLPDGTAIRIYGNNDLDPERMDAFEIGFRSSITTHLSVDIAGFYNVYDDLVTDKLTVTSAPLPTISLANGMSAEIYGGEISTTYRVLPSWRIQAAFSTMYMDLDTENASYEPIIRSGDCPRAQGSLFSSTDLSRNLEWDMWLKYVDGLPDQAVDAYVTMDARLAWEAKPDLTISVVGQNLFEPEHVEFNSEYLNVLSTEVERSISGKIEWKF